MNSIQILILVALLSAIIGTILGIYFSIVPNTIVLIIAFLISKITFNFVKKKL